MNRFIKVFFPVLLAWSYAHSQIIPGPGARLNYTQVMFEHPAVKGADEYIVQLFINIGGKDYHPLLEQKDSSTATLIGNLTFGKKYYWRYAAIKNGRQLNWNGPYNFEILNDPFIGKYRVHVIQNDSLKNAKGLICVDGIRSIVDREGTPVLFVPAKGTIAVDDLRLTKYGTLCSYGGQNAIETDLNNNKLWMTPFKARGTYSMDFGDYYNHDFKRLDNGNYMVIGSDYEWKTLPVYYYIDDYMMYNKKGQKMDDSLICKNGTLHLQGGYNVQINNDQTKVYMNLAMLCEYDKRDTLVWSWNAANYFRDTDLFPPGRDLKVPITFQQPNMNGFSIDDKNGSIYVSFRNLSRVIKLDKKTGKVVDSWGDKMPSGEANRGNGFFHNQHCPTLLKNGDMAVYDNEDTSIKSGYSKVVIFSLPSGRRHKSKILWQFVCKFDTPTFAKSVRAGSVDELFNNDLLVCQGAINRVFEVNRKKYVSWQALVERRKDTTWLPQPSYRSHYTSSLYPCYFTAQTDADSLSGKEVSFNIKIFNKGSENDSYSIKITESCSDDVKELKAGALRPGTSEVLNIHLTQQPQASEDITATVISNTNPDLRKTVFLQWLQ